MSRCEGTTVKGPRCKRTVKNGLFCHDHRKNPTIFPEFVTEKLEHLKHLNLQLHVGTSGYYYDTPNWKRWYRTRKGEWFDKYASNFNCVEVNATHYKKQSDETYKKWIMMSKKRGITFSVKLNRYASHLKWLKQPEKWWPTAWEEYSQLEDALECILIQLPGKFSRYNVKGDVDRLERLKELAKVVTKDIRLVFEFRSKDWYSEDVYNVLRENNWCLCTLHLINNNSWAGNLQSGWTPEIYTSDFAYYRLHGSLSQYKGEYGKEFLCTELANRIRDSNIKKNFIMFNNTDDLGIYGIPSAVSDAKIVTDLL